MSDTNAKEFLEAVSRNDEDVVLKFIKSGIDLNIIYDGDDEFSYKKTTALQIALGKSYKNLVELLISNGVDKFTSYGFRSNLYFACCGGQYSFAKELINHNCSLVNLKEDRGRTPLFIAVNKGHLEIVKLLIEKGADPHCVDDEGNTLLHIHTSIETMRFLLSLSIPLQQKNKKNMTPFDRYIFPIAEADKYLPQVQLLFHEGYDIRPMFIVAVKKEKNSLIKILIKIGFDINSKIFSGGTALHNAVFENNPHMVKLLLELGANTSIRSDIFNEPTPLHIASSKGFSEIVNILLISGADYTIKDLYGSYPQDIAKDADVQKLFPYNEEIASDIKNRINKAEIFIKNLEELGYFSLINDEDKQKSVELFKYSLFSRNIFEIDTDRYATERILVSRDLRWYSADAEDLAEGGAENFMHDLNQPLKIIGVEIGRVERCKTDDGSYKILFEGKEEILYTKENAELSWFETPKRIMEIVNKFLEGKNISDRLYGMNGGNDQKLGLLPLGVKELINTLNKDYIYSRVYSYNEMDEIFSASKQ